MKIVTIGFAIAIPAPLTAGLGRHQSSLDAEKVTRFEQLGPSVESPMPVYALG